MLDEIKQNCLPHQSRCWQDFLSKKFKPSSPHILETFIWKKSWNHKHFRADLLSDHLQVIDFTYWQRLKGYNFLYSGILHTSKWESTVFKKHTISFNPETLSCFNYKGVGASSFLKGQKVEAGKVVARLVEVVAHSSVPVVSHCPSMLCAPVSTGPSGAHFPHILVGCSDNGVISKYSLLHSHVCSGDQYKPFEPKKNPLAWK